jgi:hypothetical protein
MMALWTDTLAVCFFLSDRHSSDETQRQLTCNWHASLLSSCCPTLGQGLSFKLLANGLAYSSSPSDADGEAGLLGCCRKMDRLLSFAVKPEGCVLLSLCKGDEALMLSAVWLCGCGLRRRSLWPARRLRQLRLPSSNSVNTWNLHNAEHKVSARVKQDQSE